MWYILEWIGESLLKQNYFCSGQGSSRTLFLNNYSVMFANNPLPRLKDVFSISCLIYRLFPTSSLTMDLPILFNIYFIWYLFQFFLSGNTDLAHVCKGLYFTISIKPVLPCKTFLNSLKWYGLTLDTTVCLRDFTTVDWNFTSTPRCTSLHLNHQLLYHC